MAAQGKVGNGTIYTFITGYAGRTAPLSFSAIFYVSWRLHAAQAAFFKWFSLKGRIQIKPYSFTPELTACLKK